MFHSYFYFELLMDVVTPLKSFHDTLGFQRHYDNA